jgi:hypothetical protein
MKLIEIVDHHGVTRVFIPPKYKPQLDGLMEFGGMEGSDSLEYFEQIQTFLQKYPQARKMFEVFTDPKYDHRGVNPDFYKYSPDFSFWANVDGRIFWEDSLGEEIILEMQPTIFEQIKTMFIVIRDDEHLNSLIDN